MSKKLSYKELHGKTRVGAALQKIGRSDILGRIIGAGGKVLQGDYIGAVKAAITGDTSLSDKDKGDIMAAAEMDAKEMAEMTERWKVDMASDSWLSKNARPIVLMAITGLLIVTLILDSWVPSFDVKESYISLLEVLCTASYAAYFGARAVEKVNHIRRR